MGNGPPQTSGRSRGGPASHFPGTWPRTNAKAVPRFTPSGQPQASVSSARLARHGRRTTHVRLTLFMVDSFRVSPNILIRAARYTTRRQSLAQLALYGRTIEMVLNPLIPFGI
jgi:hypothetical protein